VSHQRSKALRDLREQVTNEGDPEKLRELVIEIDGLLNLIEEQVAGLRADRLAQTEPRLKNSLL
jgi:hypothetical protein